MCDHRRDELQTKTDEVTAITEKADASTSDSKTELDQLQEKAEAERVDAESKLALREEEKAAIESRFVHL